MNRTIFYTGNTRVCRLALYLYHDPPRFNVLDRTNGTAFPFNEGLDSCRIPILLLISGHKLT